MGGEADAHRRRVGVWVAFFSEVRPGLGSGWKWSQLEMCVCVYTVQRQAPHPTDAFLQCDCPGLSLERRGP